MPVIGAKAMDGVLAEPNPATLLVILASFPTIGAVSHPLENTPSQSAKLPVQTHVFVILSNAMLFGGQSHAPLEQTFVSQSALPLHAELTGHRGHRVRPQW